MPNHPYHLIWLTLAFGSGILWFHTLGEIPSLYWLIAGLLVLPVALQSRRCSIYLRLPAAAISGFLWALLNSANLPHLQLPAELETTDLQVTGWISSLPETFYRSTRFLLEVDTLSHNDQPVPFTGQIRLSWYQQPPPILKVGERWRFTVRLRRPRGFSNPGGFDYEQWLFVNTISATGYVRNITSAELLAETGRYPVGRFRQHLSHEFQQALTDNPYLGVITALALGDKQKISERQWQVFSQTGTGHLMAISGLHIGLIAATVFFLIRFAWTMLPFLTQRWPAPKAAAFASLIAAFIYALLAGWSLPTQRALIMLCVALLALLWRRPLLASRTLCIALLAVLIYDPHAPLSAGFWLSFCAVAAILYYSVGKTQPVNSLWQWLSLQIIIVIALLPLSLIFFQSTTLLSPFANLIAIPWVSATVVPLTLLAVATGFISDAWQNGLLQLAALTMAWLWGFLEWLTTSFDWAQIFLPAPPLWTLLFAIPGVVLALAPHGMPGRTLALILCLPLLFFPRNNITPGTARFTLLDVGQGLSVVIQTSTHTLVYDTGPRLGANFDAARAALIPFLRQQHIKKIDILIISHDDGYHNGGIRSLLEHLPVKRIIISNKNKIPVENAEPCDDNERWGWDEVQFRLLNPKKYNSTCLLQIEASGQRLLLTGDIDDNGQIELLEKYTDLLPNEILLAPKHGNVPALTDFIEAVQPQYVLFSTRYKNRYDIPNVQTVDSYRRFGAQILNTAVDGAISFHLGNEKTLTPERYRQQNKRYWHSP